MNNIFIVAGEVSGDLVAAWFVQHKLAQIIPGPVRLEGVGGDAMAACGVVLHSSYKDLNVVGFAEIIKKLPTIFKIMRELTEYIIAGKFTHVVLVDFGGFNMRLGARLKARNPAINIIYLAPPQVWCWAQWRLKQLKKISDELVVLFPFEATWYAQQKVSVRYLGNPVADRVLSAVVQGNCPRFRLGIFPGSRTQELVHFVPLMRDVLVALLSKFTDLEIAIFQAPNIDNALLQSLRKLAPQQTFLVPPEDRLAAMQSCVVALTKAGTVTLELGLLQVPTIIFYKTHWLTYALAKALVSIDRMGLPNLIAQRDVMPEFIQQECSTDNLVVAVSEVLAAYQKNDQSYAHRRDQLAVLKQLFAQTS